MTQFFRFFAAGNDGSGWAMSLRIKLLFAFGSIVLCTAFSIAIGVSSLIDMRDEVRMFSSQQLPSIERASRIAALSSALAQDTTLLAHARTQGEREMAYRAVTTLYDQLISATSGATPSVANRMLMVQIDLFGRHIDELNRLAEERIAFAEERDARLTALFELHRKANEQMSGQVDRGGRKAAGAMDVGERLELQRDVGLLTMRILRGVLDRDAGQTRDLQSETPRLLASIVERAVGLNGSSLLASPAAFNPFVSTDGGIISRHRAELSLLEKATRATNTALTGTRSIASSAQALTNHATRTIGNHAAQLEEVVDRDSNRLVFVGVISIAAACFIWFFMVDRGLSAPLHRLTETTHRLATGSHDLAIPGTRRRDEIGAMSRALEVFKANAQDVKRMADELEVALVREKELNALQRQFVSMVSHEFRTPLAIIDGTAQRLDKRLDQLPADRQRQALGKIRTAVARLIGLMESVLSLARLDAGKLELKRSTIDIKAMMGEICGNHEGLSPRHSIESDLTGLTDHLEVDEILLRQVFVNLMSNAVKYSPQGGVVKVCGRQTEDDVRISISDPGVGIPEDELPRLFERFFRATSATGIPGTGIGLNLVKQIVELHGGRIDVESEQERGSTFTVVLSNNSRGQSEPAYAKMARQDQRCADFT